MRFAHAFALVIAAGLGLALAARRPAHWPITAALAALCGLALLRTSLGAPPTWTVVWWFAMALSSVAPCVCLIGGSVALRRSGTTWATRRVAALLLASLPADAAGYLAWAREPRGYVAEQVVSVAFLAVIAGIQAHSLYRERGKIRS